MRSAHLSIAASTLVLLLAGCAAQTKKKACPERAPRPAPAAVVAPTVRGASSSAIARRLLRCAEARLATSSVAASTRLDLEGWAAEGAGAEVFERREQGYLRIAGELLGESTRERFDYRFVDQQLICVTAVQTSLWTVQAKSDDNPDGRPPFWRRDFRVFDDRGKLVRHVVDEAPGKDQPSTDLAETLKRAAQLRQMAAKALAAAKKKP